ncbi:MAG TPA: hypothetical protein VMU88_07700 [bacterium]|nr:hypothetical protein [bacterium]
MKKGLQVLGLVFMMLALALASPGWAKGSASHGAKSAKASKSHASHKGHHHAAPKVAKVEHPMDDGPPAGWH